MHVKQFFCILYNTHLYLHVYGLWPKIKSYYYYYYNSSTNYFKPWRRGLLLSPFWLVAFLPYFSPFWFYLSSLWPQLSAFSLFPLKCLPSNIHIHQNCTKLHNSVVSMSYQVIWSLDGKFWKLWHFKNGINVIEIHYVGTWVETSKWSHFVACDVL